MYVWPISQCHSVGTRRERSARPRMEKTPSPSTKPEATMRCRLRCEAGRRRRQHSSGSAAVGRGARARGRTCAAAAAARRANQTSNQTSGGSLVSWPRLPVFGHFPFHFPFRGEKGSALSVGAPQEAGERGRGWAVFLQPPSSKKSSRPRRSGPKVSSGHHARWLPAASRAPPFFFFMIWAQTTSKKGGMGPEDFPVGYHFVSRGALISKPGPL